MANFALTFYNASIRIIMGVIEFTKMHGIGNDYIYINCLNGSPDYPAKLAKAMSPRHTSVGSDGIILIMPSESADSKMRIFNADGYEARMCGNGSRCVGKYVYDHRITDKTEITLETLSGVKHFKMRICPECGMADYIHLSGGRLMIDMNSKGHILMTGPAVEVFRGTYINPSEPDLG